MKDRTKTTHTTENKRLQALGRAVIRTETAAVRQLAGRIDQNFVAACKLLLACSGRIVVIGMGKSGHIGGKIAATLASTGSPAFFVHPAEASHGDLGMITGEDVVIALSNSGENDEITTLLPAIKRLGIPLITLSGNPQSTLGRAATIHIDVSVEKEACPLGLAPTSSTTATLVMGDALAIALLEARGFGPEDFARSHPGGVLGRRLLLRVNDIMHTGSGLPKVRQDTPLRDALLEMTRKGLGTTAVVDKRDRILGIYTDGDLRRSLDAGVDVHRVLVGEVMTANCKTISPESLASEALSMMESCKINALLVAGEDRVLLGMLNMHDLLRAKVV
ncbi:MAG: D-arabinose 5-phosphate isomerase [Gammaproteobacteria bacterium RIFCSPLOWO2_02_FULL_56_15]|nr:MAG: D-arabinose 5-phosphate isomerase [Gammaproteobacteria bacterium RIFCSPLOWO2_02_FULL_56_15]